MQPPELEKGWINDSWESIAAPAHLSWPFLQLQVYLCLSQQDAFWGLGITAPPGLIQEPIHHHRLQQS